ncbi:MAG: hypothetical protein ABW137_14340 [Mycobacterium sp.]
MAIERTRDASHNSLRHGGLIMDTLVTVVRVLLPELDVVIAKGGITSAEVARAGVGALAAVGFDMDAAPSS